MSVHEQATTGPTLDVECSRCTGELDLHQPVTHEPALLFGVCVGCGLVHILKIEDVVAVTLLTVRPLEGGGFQITG
jgi:hypothetical protein